MQSCSPLQAVIDRVGYTDPAISAYFFWDEVQIWDASVLQLLINEQLLTPTQHRTFITCNGCEENCGMPVHVFPAEGNREARAFISCDKPNDMGHINVAFDSLKQWHSSAAIFAAMLARMLGIKTTPTKESSNSWLLGAMAAKNTAVPIKLKIEKGLHVSLGGNSISVLDVLTITKGKLALNKAALQRYAENTKTTEMPEQRRQRLLTRQNELKAQGVKNFQQQVAQEEGISRSMLKKIIANAKKKETGLTLQEAWKVSSRRE